jgi:hypothetical protein
MFPTIYVILLQLFLIIQRHYVFQTWNLHVVCFDFKIKILFLVSTWMYRC